MLSTNDDAYLAWSDSRNGAAGVPLIVALEAALVGAGIAMLVAIGLTRRRRAAESAAATGGGERL